MEIHELWLDTIKKDIVQKYAILNPVFFMNAVMLGDSTFDACLKEAVTPPRCWLKYKKIGKATFELKPFLADPEDKITGKMIDDFLSCPVYKEGQTYFTVNKYVSVQENRDDPDSPWMLKDLPGVTYYNLNEARVELRSLLRRGYSKMTLERESAIKDNVKVYHLHVGGDSLENMLKSGYLQLEYD